MGLHGFSHPSTNQSLKTCSVIHTARSGVVGKAYQIGGDGGDGRPKVQRGSDGGDGRRWSRTNTLQIDTRSNGQRECAPTVEPTSATFELHTRSSEVPRPKSAPQKRNSRPGTAAKYLDETNARLGAARFSQDQQRDGILDPQKHGVLDPQKLQEIVTKMHSSLTNEASNDMDSSQQRENDQLLPGSAAKHSPEVMASPSSVAEELLKSSDASQMVQFEMDVEYAKKCATMPTMDFDGKFNPQNGLASGESHYTPGLYNGIMQGSVVPKYRRSNMSRPATAGMSRRTSICAAKDSHNHADFFGARESSAPPGNRVGCRGFMGSKDSSTLASEEHGTREDAERIISCAGVQAKIHSPDADEQRPMRPSLPNTTKTYSGDHGSSAYSAAKTYRFKNLEIGGASSSTNDAPAAGKGDQLALPCDEGDDVKGGQLILPWWLTQQNRTEQTRQSQSKEIHNGGPAAESDPWDITGDVGGWDDESFSIPQRRYDDLQFNASLTQRSKAAKDGDWESAATMREPVSSRVLDLLDILDRECGPSYPRDGFTSFVELSKDYQRRAECPICAEEWIKIQERIKVIKDDDDLENLIATLSEKRRRLLTKSKRTHTVKCSYMWYQENLMVQIRNQRFPPKNAWRQEEGGGPPVPKQVSAQPCATVLPPPMADVVQYWKDHRRHGSRKAPQ